MSSIVTELLFILVLLVANGLFALAEVAVVASRKARLQQRVQAGNQRAQVALDLAESPNRFLATVQIGITLVGILAGAFGGATLSSYLSVRLETIPAIAPYAGQLSFALVVLLITYLSLVIGELVPKRLALHSPERIASLVAPPMQALSRATAPVVSFLDASTNAILALIGLRASDEPSVTEEEITLMIDQGRQAGIFVEEEQELVGRIFRLTDRSVSQLMTPRPDIQWLDLRKPWETNRTKLTEIVFSRIPVCDGSLDRVVGVLRAKNLLDRYLDGQTADITESLLPPVFVPETISSYRLMESFRTSRTHMIFVIDEHGTVQGVVTLQDILAAIIGDLPMVDESDESYAVQRDDGSWLLDGLLSIEEFKELFGLDDSSLASAGDFHTVSGLVISKLGRLPVVTDSFEIDGLRVEVVDLDRHRVDKVLVTKIEAAGSASEA